jgi:hypothetical protein
VAAGSTNPAIALPRSSASANESAIKAGAVVVRAYLDRLVARHRAHDSLES